MSWLPFALNSILTWLKQFLPGELFNSKLNLPSAEQIAEAKAQQKSDAAFWWQWHVRMHQVLVWLCMNWVSHAWFGCPRVHFSMEMKHPFKRVKVAKNLGLKIVESKPFSWVEMCGCQPIYFCNVYLGCQLVAASIHWISFQCFGFSSYQLEPAFSQPLTKDEDSTL